MLGEAARDALAAIGEYRIDDDLIEWDSPRALQEIAPGFELVFEADDVDIWAQDGPVLQMCGHFDRFVAEADSLLTRVRQNAVELFREVYADQLDSDELASYRSPDGQIDDTLVLAALEPRSIELARVDEGVLIRVTHHSDWDDEHGIECEIANGEILSPWRD